MTARKTVFVKERVVAEAGSPALRPVCRVAAIAVIQNPFAGRFEEDLSALFDSAQQLLDRDLGLLNTLLLLTSMARRLG